jgi:hypothetical protein
MADALHLSRPAFASGRDRRPVHSPFICTAPQYLAEEFLPLERFPPLDEYTQWSYLPLGVRLGPNTLAAGQADMAM